MEIAALNGFMRTKAPANHVIDFDSWMPAEWMEEMLFRANDGVHVGCAAHAIRAQKVEAAIR